MRPDNGNVAGRSTQSLDFMVKVSDRAAAHIQKALGEELNQLTELERLPEAERPDDFDVNDIWLTRNMISEFQAAREIEPRSPSFQFAVAAIYGYVERHRTELQQPEFNELFRIYAEMLAAASLSTAGGGTAKRNLERIIQLGAMNP